jgi:hypothetical protein
MGRLTYIAAIRRFFVAISSISVLLLQIINRTSSSAESSLSTIYNSRRIICFDIVFIEGSNFWSPAFCYLNLVSVDNRVIMIVSFDNNIIIGFKFDFIRFRFRSNLSRSS